MGKITATIGSVDVLFNFYEYQLYCKSLYASIQDFTKKKQGFISRLDKLKREFALKDNDTLAKYHQSFWEEFIFNAGQQYDYDIPNNILVDLTKRWAFFDKSYSVQYIMSS